MVRKLFTNVRLIDSVANIDRVSNVLLEDGKITKISPGMGINQAEFDQDIILVDGSEMVLGTGLVDLYSHSGEPGNETRETIASLLQAGAAGGFTRICILPDTEPTIDHPGILTQVYQAGMRARSQYSNSASFSNSSSHSSLPHLSVWSAITHNLAGDGMVEFADLARDAVGFADGKSLANLELVRKFLEYIQPFGKPVALSACDRNVRANGVVREGEEAVRLGLPMVPVSAESSAIASLLEVIKYTSTPVHFMRLSTARGVELIAQAKQQGLPVTASTTWLHVLNCTNDLFTYHPCLRLEPPLGNPGDRAALRDGLRTGIIDAIAIDHAAFTYEEKTVAFAEAPPGAIGLEIALPLLWQNLVVTGEFTALELWRVLSSQPARCLGLEIKEINPANSVDLTLFNPNQTWLMTAKNLHSPSQNSSWYGQEIIGKVAEIIVSDEGSRE